MPALDIETTIELVPVEEPATRKAR
jgi:hypothetical protein